MGIKKEVLVTILILIDGFLQYRRNKSDSIAVYGHNPYFNRWFSAIEDYKWKSEYDYCHNPYFNRWFSAIKLNKLKLVVIMCHNPYFNRWFSAI